jgi:hypothetical protein
MATTFNFEELDGATHDYLVAVRESEGLGSPGVFVTTSDSLPGCGCVMGPIIIGLTLALTCTTWAGIIYDDPIGVALLQTAGLLLGGWLLMAKFRGGRGNDRVAGTWVYADPLYLYEAYREQVTVTPIADVVEAHFTHNYNNGSYQNSVVAISMGGHLVTTVTFANEARAEQLVVYLNYLAWARGPDGGQRATLAPATLGGLAKYVAKNDHEPLDAESNINLNLIELDITEVPEEPTREGRATPAVMPYIFMILFAAATFFVMAFVVNPDLRDDAIFEAVMKEPSVEPRFLRAYLVDTRNRKHRDEVTKRLSRFYDSPIQHVTRNGGDKSLREGMAAVLESVRTADQPVVSIRVTEKGTPVNKEGSKSTREGNLRTKFVNGINDEFSKQPWGVTVQPPPGMTFKETPPPVGQQLLAFVEAPEGADKVHFDITYTITPDENFRMMLVSVTVEIRANIDDPIPAGKATLVLPSPVDLSTIDEEMLNKIRDKLVQAMVGMTNPAAPPPFGMPGGGGFNPNP